MGGSAWKRGHEPRLAPGRSVASGFLPRIPGDVDLDVLNRGAAELSVWSPGIVACVRIADVRAVDVIRWRVVGPDGWERTHDEVRESAVPRLTPSFGRAREEGPLPAGRYEASVQVLRDGVVLDREDRAVQVK